MKQCSKCKERRDKKEHFTVRSISKKTGKPLYVSWCNDCRAKHARTTTKNIPCIHCGKPHNPSFKACRKCLPSTVKKKKRKPRVKYVKLKTPINPKWLVRGLIHNTSRASIFGQDA